MRTQLMAASLLGSCLLTSMAMAQPQGQPPTGSTDSGPANSKFTTQEGSPGILRVSDLIGQSVVGPDNKSMGKIEDVVLDPNGKIAAYVVEVGGALGIGGRKVAVPVYSVQVEPVDTTASTGTVQSQGLPPSTAEGQKARKDMQISRVLTPRRIVVTIPADQLKSAPAFDND